MKHELREGIVGCAFEVCRNKLRMSISWLKHLRPILCIFILMAKFFKKDRSTTLDALSVAEALGATRSKEGPSNLTGGSALRTGDSTSEGTVGGLLARQKNDSRSAVLQMEARKDTGVAVELSKELRSARALIDNMEGRIRQLEGNSTDALKMPAELLPAQAALTQVRCFSERLA